MRVFFLFLEYLETLNEISQKNEIAEVEKNLITQGFIFKLLDALGYKLETSRCVRCEGSLSKESNYFDYSRGGITCYHCASKSSSVLPISNNSIKIMRIFFKNKINNLSKLKINKRESLELSYISDTFIKWIC